MSSNYKTQKKKKKTFKLVARQFSNTDAKAHQLRRTRRSSMSGSTGTDVDGGVPGGRPGREGEGLGGDRRVAAVPAETR